MTSHNTEHTVVPQQQPSMMVCSCTIRWMIVPLSVVVLLFSRVNAFVITTSTSTSSGYIPTHRMIQSRSTLNSGRRNPDNVLLLLSTTTKLNEDEEDIKIQNNSIPSSSSSLLLPDYGTTPIEIDQIKIIKKKWRRPELYGQSLIEQTMNEITNQSSKENNSASTGITNVPLTKEERIAQRRSLQQAKSVPNFEQHVHAMAAATASTTTTSSSSPLQLLNRKSIPTILQINIGLYCNQACQHCHVESSPLRTKEMMTMDVILQCLTILKNTPSITTLDITGGAPELHEHFRTLISMARSIRPDPKDLDIIDRCNLTVLYEPNQGNDLIQFLQRHHVHIVASLPCYSEANVNAQRGNQVFERSIAALIAFNDAGFGITDLEQDNSDAAPTYKLDLVYNPAGAFLPPPQDKLQEQYKEQLYNNFGIVFNDLFTITNMPIQRFADYLYRRDELIEYMDLLVRNYNPATIENVMCQNTVSIRYDGIIYDCDFNQQLDIPILTMANDVTSKSEDTVIETSTQQGRRRRPLTVFDISSLDDILFYHNKIRTDVHCFGCTAGMGSSCQGATATE